jgi:hypothetical protein
MDWMESLVYKDWTRWIGRQLLVGYYKTWGRDNCDANSSLRHCDWEDRTMECLYKCCPQSLGHIFDMSPDIEGNIYYLIPKVNNYELRPMILTFRPKDFLHHGQIIPTCQCIPNDVMSEGDISKMKKQILKIERKNKKTCGHYPFPTGRHIKIWPTLTSVGDVSKFFMNTWCEWANGIHGNLLEVQLVGIRNLGNPLCPQNAAFLCQ